jgi:hypothetical protein
MLTMAKGDRVRGMVRGAALAGFAVACCWVWAAGEASASAGLPDGRAYELVSTSGNFGEPYQPNSPLSFERVGVESSSLPFAAAEDGNSVGYIGEPPATGGSGETGPGEGNQWLASRTETGWTTTAITPVLHHSEFPAYQTFSGDLSVGIFMGGEQPLAPGVPAGCRMLYARDANGAYRALFSTLELPEEVTFNLCGHPLFAGASEHESRVVFQSEAALAKPAKEAELPPNHFSHSETGEETGEPCMFGCNLYESETGHLTLVSVLEGHPVPNATFGGYSSEENTYTDLSNVISRDGSRIFWTDTQEGEKFEHIYVFENEVGNVQVSGTGPAQYWTATPDGRYAYYTEEGELWRFDTTPGAPEPRKRLTAEGAGVLGVVGTNQTGEDGAYVYFVADGVALAANKNAEGETARSGKPNLYLLHEDETTFIATLDEHDNKLSASSTAIHPGGDWRPSLGERTAEVAPDGRHLVFESVRSLTGYGNEINPGHPVVEVFVYAADKGQLVCSSCDPSGAPPVIRLETEGTLETRLPEGADVYTSTRRWMSENGNRVFFDSEQPLGAQDTNGVQDVYEWEREGEGSCAGQAVSPLDHGCVFLLSSGSGRGYSFLVDADAKGENVFFTHEGPLGQVQAPVDHNELYDARVGGGFPQTSVSCVGGACQGGAPPQPSFSSPATSGFAGVGDYPPPSPPGPPKRVTHPRSLTQTLAACRHRPRRERIACERQARRRYGLRSRTGAKRSQRRAGK